MTGLNTALWIALLVTSITTALSLSLQTVISDFVQGFWLHRIERRISIGDVLTVAAPTGVITGTVTDIHIRATILVTTLGEEVLVPNTMIFTTTIIKNKDMSPDFTITKVLRGITTRIGVFNQPPTIPSNQLGPAVPPPGS